MIAPRFLIILPEMESYDESEVDGCFARLLEKPKQPEKKRAIIRSMQKASNQTTQTEELKERAVGDSTKD